MTTIAYGLLKRILLNIPLYVILALAVVAPGNAQSGEERKPFAPVSGAWRVNVMENAPIPFGHRWFAVDAFNEELHILYFHTTEENSPNYLIYGFSSNNGESWKLDTIDGSAEPFVPMEDRISIAPFNGSMAVDRCGVPHLFYTVNNFYDHLRMPSWAIHVRKVDGKWIRDTVEARDSGESMINFDVDIAIGSDNEPRVLYIHGESEPMYGQRIGGEWKIEPVPVFAHARYLCASLALDLQDNPHIAVGKYYGLEYLTKSEGKWLAYSGADDVYGPDITVDLMGRPHILYAQPVSQPFHHTTLENGEWLTSVVEANVIKGSANTKRARIEIDPEGTLHSVYYGHNTLSNPEYIVYASSTDGGGTWKEEVVEYAGRIYAETAYPDLVVTDKLIGIFYKGEGNIPRFAYKEHSKPRFRRGKGNDCGQAGSGR